MPEGLISSQWPSERDVPCHACRQPRSLFRLECSCVGGPLVRRGGPPVPYPYPYSRHKAVSPGSLRRASHSPGGPVCLRGGDLFKVLVSQTARRLLPLTSGSAV